MVNITSQRNYTNILNKSLFIDKCLISQLIQ